MKVCHMTTVHNILDNRIFYKECVSLAQNNYDVYLVERGESFEKDKVNVVGLGEISKNRLVRMIKDTKRAFDIAIKLDCEIYHLHDPELLLIANKLKNRGKIVIFDSHEKYDCQIAEKRYLGFLAKPVSRLYNRFETLILKKIDGVIFPCTINGVNPFKGKSKHVAIVGNQPIIDINADAENDVYINSACYVGAVRPDRGITQIVKGCNIANIPLNLAGQPYPRDFINKVFSLDEKNLVNYFGFVDKDKSIDIINKSTIGLVTELNVGQNNILDTLPTKAYEYMSCGLPVIISKSKYVDSLLEKYKFGISVDPENVQEISDAIMFLIDNPDEARKMGKNGREAVMKEFNWLTEEKKLLDLYSSLSSPKEKRS